MANVVWLVGDAVTVAGYDYEGATADEAAMTPDIVHATERVAYWGPNVRRVVCVRITYGPAASYVRKADEPVNCIACIAEGYRGNS